jgi:uncharacterized OB-fold protein
MNTLSQPDNEEKIAKKVKTSKLIPHKIENTFCGTCMRTPLQQTEGIIQSYIHIGGPVYDKNSITIALIQADSGEMISARICSEDISNLKVGSRAAIFSKKTNTEDNGGLLHYCYNAKLLK